MCAKILLLISVGKNNALIYARSEVQTAATTKKNICAKNMCTLA